MDYPVQAPPPALAICQRWTEDKPQRPVEYVPNWNLLFDYLILLTFPSSDQPKCLILPTLLRELEMAFSVPSPLPFRGSPIVPVS
jgi:hypothetical protein